MDAEPSDNILGAVVGKDGVGFGDSGEGNGAAGVERGEEGEIKGESLGEAVDVVVGNKAHNHLIGVSKCCLLRGYRECD